MIDKTGVQENSRGIQQKPREVEVGILTTRTKQEKEEVSYSNPNHQAYQEWSEGKGSDYHHFKDNRNVNWAKNWREFAKRQIAWIED